MMRIDFLKIARFGFIPMMLGLVIFFVYLVLTGFGVQVTLNPVILLGLVGGGMLFVGVFLVAEMFNSF